MTLQTTTGRGPIYISGEGSGAISDQIGQAHYSYRFVEDGYRLALRHAGFDPTVIPHPEFYSRTVDLPSFTIDAPTPTIHICIRSTENVRLCRPLYNVQMFAWEFDVLRTDEIHGDSPFDNQLHMLNVADEVWTLCSYSRKVLREHGVRNVRVVPGAIKYTRQPMPKTNADRAAALARLGGYEVHWLVANTFLASDNPANAGVSCSIRKHSPLMRAAETGSLFVSVLNPHDLRKNLESLLLGFNAVTATHETAALIIKLNLPSQFRTSAELNSVLNGRLPTPTSIVNERIVFVMDYLDDDALGDLYRASSFYISSALAEGQNLPLQEAMIHGSVAVSPIHTAMLDYLDDTNCVAMKSERTGMWVNSIAANHARRPFEVSRPRIVDVARAANRALALSSEVRSDLAERGATSIEKSYSVPAISRLMTDIHDEVTAGYRIRAGTSA